MSANCTTMSVRGSPPRPQLNDLDAGAASALSALNTTQVTQMVCTLSCPFVPGQASRRRLVPLRLGTLWARSEVGNDPGRGLGCREPRDQPARLTHPDWSGVGAGVPRRAPSAVEPVCPQGVPRTKWRRSIHSKAPIRTSPRSSGCPAVGQERPRFPSRSKVAATLSTRCRGRSAGPGRV
jgi:hypothetical protein